MYRRPSYDLAYGHFKHVLGDRSLEHVAAMLGGKVKTNIEIPIEQGGFSNACAIRISYVLNKCGVKVPHIEGVPGQRAETVSDETGTTWYIYRVKILRRFLTERFGLPDYSGPSATHAALADKRGIVLFDVGIWRDATGHATLWDGKRRECADTCYFLDSKVVDFWALN